MDDNKKDGYNEDDSKVEFFFRVGKQKNYFNCFIEQMGSHLNEKINKINVEVNGIKNYLWRYGLE